MAQSDSPRTRRSPRLPADVRTAIEAARGRKADDLVVLDLRKAGAFTDFFVVCTGQNTRQVQAIADAVEMALKAEGTRPAHVEGYNRGEWILLDYFDLIVHVFSPQARSFYGLERLWGNAEVMSLPDDAAPRAAVRVEADAEAGDTSPDAGRDEHTDADHEPADDAPPPTARRRAPRASGASGAARAPRAPRSPRTRR